MLADRVVVLEDGRIAEEGPTRDVLQRPQEPLRCRARRAEFRVRHPRRAWAAGTPAWISTASTTTCPAPSPAGQPGVAVFPPSAVSVFLTEAHGSPRNSFAVTVTDLEPHGDRIRVRAGAGGQLSADITPEASADLGLVPGMQVHFVVKAGAVSIYPA